MAEASDKAGQSLKKFEDATKSAEESISDMRFELEALNAGFSDTEEFALNRAMREAQAEVDNTAATVERLRTALENVDSTTSGRGADRLSTLRTQLALEEQNLEKAREQLEEYTRLSEKLKENTDAYSDMYREVSNLLDLERVRNAFGEESARFRQVALQQEIDAELRKIDVKERSGELTADQARYLREATEQAIRLESKNDLIASSLTESGEKALYLQRQLGLSYESAASLAQTNIETGVLKAAEAARTLAEQLGVSLRTAMAMQGMIVEGDDPKRFDPRSPRYDPEAARHARLKEMIDSGELYNSVSTSSSNGSGGGGGSVSQTTNQVKDLTNALKEQETVLQSVGKTMASSFGDALMGIVDGTKTAADAFKDMARQILKQAFEMLVVKPIMDSIMGAFGVSTGGLGMSQSNASALVSQTITALQANGGAWSNGVQMYANGGVVGSPTAFQHKGGTAFQHKGGLGVMGEAGPEAIMPLKRGKNGKLGVQSEGSQGNVTVENHFHISANGDDSVKRIIQQEAPKIANYTQQQILDQRRRGGAMKSTFGG